MTDRQANLRGYDDSRYLKEMADGIIVRRYASVEDAAKSVLGEDTGSNIDRLRRKFREQNWYDRGLNDYVEAEINRRQAEELSEAPDNWFVNSKGVPMGAREITAVKWFLAVINHLTPSAFFAYGSVGSVWLLIGMHLIGISLTSVLAVLGAVSSVSMCLWAIKSARSASALAAAFHLLSLAGIYLAIIVGLRHLVPEPALFAGSLPGGLAFAAGTITISAYLIEFARKTAAKAGRDKSPEFIGLALVVTMLGVFGGITPAVQDIKLFTKKEEVALEAAGRIERAMSALRQGNPLADLSPLVEAQRSILEGLDKVPASKIGEQ